MKTMTIKTRRVLLSAMLVCTFSVDAMEYYLQNGVDVEFEQVCYDNEVVSDYEVLDTYGAMSGAYDNVFSQQIPREYRKYLVSEAVFKDITEENDRERRRARQSLEEFELTNEQYPGYTVEHELHLDEAGVFLYCACKTVKQFIYFLKNADASCLFPNTEEMVMTNHKERMKLLDTSHIHNTRCLQQYGHMLSTIEKNKKISEMVDLFKKLFDFAQCFTCYPLVHDRFDTSQELVLLSLWRDKMREVATEYRTLLATAQKNKRS